MGLGRGLRNRPGGIPVGAYPLRSAELPGGHDVHEPVRGLRGRPGSGQHGVRVGEGKQPLLDPEHGIGLLPATRRHFVHRSRVGLHQLAP